MHVHDIVGGTNPERNDSNPQIYEVIRATNGTYGMVFVGVQAEPDSARYFNFDNMSVQNTVRTCMHVCTSSHAYVCNTRLLEFDITVRLVHVLHVQVIGTDNCPHGSISEDASFIWMSAGSVWGGANGPGQSATIGEESNTISAHKVVCGSVNVTPPLGAFRGGVDLCASEWSARSEVATLKEKVWALEKSYSEMKKLVQTLLER